MGGRVRERFGASTSSSRTSARWRSGPARTLERQLPGRPHAHGAVCERHCRTCRREGLDRRRVLGVRTRDRLRQGRLWHHEGRRDPLHLRAGLPARGISVRANCVSPGNTYFPEAVAGHRGATPICSPGHGASTHRRMRQPRDRLRRDDAREPRASFITGTTSSSTVPLPEECSSTSCANSASPSPNRAGRPALPASRTAAGGRDGGRLTRVPLDYAVSSPTTGNQ